MTNDITDGSRSRSKRDKRRNRSTNVKRIIRVDYDVWYKLNLLSLKLDKDVKDIVSELLNVAVKRLKITMEDTDNDD